MNRKREFAMTRGRRARWGAAALLTAVLLALIPHVAYAHGFGERYDLPVPLSFYVTGAGAVVALSFVVIAVFVRGVSASPEYPRYDLLRFRAVRFLAGAPVIVPIRAAAVGVLALVIIAGSFGHQHPLQNIAPTLTWIVWWVGLTFVVAFLGNVWALINPWRTMFEWTDALVSRAVPGGRLSLDLPYPERWGAWPAVVLFVAFAWVEIVFTGSSTPGTLALLAVGYSLITWAGMMVFGCRAWLDHGEVFTLVFGFLARFAPLELRVRDETGGTVTVDEPEEFRAAPAGMRELALRPPGAGLLHTQGVTTSRMALVVIVLSSVTVDGFTQTPLWAEVITYGLTTVPGWGRNMITLLNTGALVVFAGGFLLAYLGFARVMAREAEPGPGRTLAVARDFAFTLVPIALAYHLAHFFSYLLIQGQLMIPLASDPLGLGWDLFGAAGYRVDVGIVDARLAWIVAVGAIVLGHIIAVWLAHVVALRHFGERGAALRSQRVMLVLMVGYTMISLWILAQPITNAA